MNLVPVNMTIKEKIQRLRDGEVFYTVGGGKIYYDKNENGNPFRFEWSPLDVLFPEQWYKEQNWYDNIPEKGVPCWVWNYDESERQLRLVVEVKNNINHEFRFLEDSRDIYWKHARPATKEELFDE